MDAVLCAYVGLFSVRRPEATTTYGSLAEGYIVTPALGMTPQEQPDPVAGAVRAYAAQEPALRGAAEQAVALVRTVLDEAGIKKLADLESREVLLAKVAGAAQASLSQAAALFQAPLSKTVRTAEALRAKVEETGSDTAADA